MTYCCRIMCDTINHKIERGHIIMSDAVWFISYKLVEGASVPDFLLASEKTHNEVLSKKKGFISWKVLVDGDMNPIAQKFYSFIDPNSLKSQFYSV